MPDLSPGEREALDRLLDSDQNWGTICREELVSMVQRALAAVPRLREVEGMGLEDRWTWHVRYPTGLSIPEGGKTRSVQLAAVLNKINGPGHHAVRLAVVEVATPEEGGQDG